MTSRKRKPSREIKERGKRKRCEESGEWKPCSSSSCQLLSSHFAEAKLGSEHDNGICETEAFTYVGHNKAVWQDEEYAYYLLELTEGEEKLCITPFLDLPQLKHWADFFVESNDAAWLTESYFTGAPMLLGGFKNILRMTNMNTGAETRLRLEASSAFPSIHARCNALRSTLDVLRSPKIRGANVVEWNSLQKLTTFTLDHLSSHSSDFVTTVSADFNPRFQGFLCLAKWSLGSSDSKLKETSNRWYFLDPRADQVNSLGEANIFPCYSSNDMKSSHWIDDFRFVVPKTLAPTSKPSYMKLVAPTFYDFRCLKKSIHQSPVSVPVWRVPSYSGPLRSASVRQGKQAVWMTDRYYRTIVGEDFQTPVKVEGESRMFHQVVASSSKDGIAPDNLCTLGRPGSGDVFYFTKEDNVAKMEKCTFV